MNLIKRNFLPLQPKILGKAFYRLTRGFMALFQGYHIIIVPRDKNKTRTLKVSGLSLKILVMSFLLAVPVFLLSVLSAIHYQNRMVAVKRMTSEDHALLKNKRHLVAQIANVEKKLTLMNDTLTNLGDVMDIDVSSMKVGLGPVAETDLSLPLDESVNVQDLLDADSEKVADEWIEQNGDITMDKFSVKLSQLKTNATYLSKKIEDLYAQNKDKIRFANAIPTEMPTPGWVTSDFGMRAHPISHSQRLHQGLDIASSYGSPIKAPADGFVLFAGYHGGHGQVVLVDHGYGVSTLYAHASHLHVKAGDRVKRGQVIANVGTSGASTGPHLHYEVRVDGIPVDPTFYIAKK